MPLDEAIASITMIVTVLESDGRVGGNGFGANQITIKTVSLEIDHIGKW